MCRNITVLRGLEPPASPDEVADAARQFVRKIAGLSTPQQMTRPEVQHAIDVVAAATQSLLATLPPRRVPPPGPPGRRRGPATTP